MLITKKDAESVGILDPQIEGPEVNLALQLSRVYSCLFIEKVLRCPLHRLKHRKMWFGDHLVGGGGLAAR